MELVHNFWPGTVNLTCNRKTHLTQPFVSPYGQRKYITAFTPPNIRATEAGRRVTMCSIADFIPEGHKNAIKREQLRELTGMSDREMRDSLHYARRDTVIVNAQDGNGYFKPNMEDRALFNKYFSQEDSRLKSQGWAMKAARALKKKYS